MGFKNEIIPTEKYTGGPLDRGKGFGRKEKDYNPQTYNRRSLEGC